MCAGLAASLRSCSLALALSAGLPTVTFAQHGVLDLLNRPVHPLEAGDGARATVLVFTAVDCPISDRYAPELKRLRDGFTGRGVRFWLVYPNAGERPASVRAHAEAFGYGMPVALDVRGALVDAAEASVTPETAVFDRAGRLVYRGRIDDRYIDFGIDRPAATRRDLAEAIEAVLDRRAVTTPVTRAIGCAIVRERP